MTIKIWIHGNECVCIEGKVGEGVGGGPEIISKALDRC